MPVAADQVYRYAHELCSGLGLIFSFPTRDAYRGLTKTEKYLLLDIPDVLLVVSVIVATKYICPLDELERTPASQDDPLTLKMDWAAWNAEFPEPATKRAQVDFAKITSDEVPSTGKDELHQYMDWFQQTQIHTTPLDREPSRAQDPSRREDGS
jgi:RNA polymerase I-specific transcription initiation factor RRN7